MGSHENHTGSNEAHKIVTGCLSNVLRRRLVAYQGLSPGVHLANRASDGAVSPTPTPDRQGEVFTSSRSECGVTGDTLGHVITPCAGPSAVRQTARDSQDKKPPAEGFTREISPCTSRCTSCWTNNCSDKGYYASRTHATGIIRIPGEGSQPTQPTNAVRDNTLPKRNDDNGCLGLRMGHEVVARHVGEKLLAEPTCHAYHGEIANGSSVIAEGHGTSKPSANQGQDGDDQIRQYNYSLPAKQPGGTLGSYDDRNSSNQCHNLAAQDNPPGKAHPRSRQSRSGSPQAHRSPQRLVTEPRYLPDNTQRTVTRRCGSLYQLSDHTVTFIRLTVVGRGDGKQ